uniref:Uncharacterized protein n=1 Tax=Parascaris univalens TaxID=6257 RepID=A0A915AFT9_PARUN
MLVTCFESNPGYALPFGVGWNRFKSHVNASLVMMLLSISLQFFREMSYYDVIPIDTCVSVFLRFLSNFYFPSKKPWKRGSRKERIVDCRKFGINFIISSTGKKSTENGCRKFSICRQTIYLNCNSPHSLRSKYIQKYFFCKRNLKDTSTCGNSRNC